jgi:hypothetical protein
LNKSENDQKTEVLKMKTCINSLMKDSKLIYKNSIKDLSSSHLQQANIKKSSNNNRNNNKMASNEGDVEDVNLVLLPKLDETNNVDKNEINKMFDSLPTFNRSIENLTNEILSIHSAKSRANRHQNSNMSEKKW